MRTESIELLPRHAFLAPLIAGARVLELGAPDPAIGEAAAALRARGAASVLAVGHGAAVERARREHGDKAIAFSSAPLAQLPAGAFDLLLVHDAAAVLAPGAAATLLLRLAAGGRLVVAVPAPGPSLVATRAGAATYGALLDVLRPLFPSIEVATQQALVGWVVSPAPASRPALAVDDGFASGEAPAFHLFVCGQAPAGLSAQLLVPLPATPVLGGWGERGGDVIAERERARAEGLVAELRDARERIAERESWIEGLRHEVEQRHLTAEEQTAELKAAQVKLVKLEREHGEATESLRRIREQLVARTRELDGARRAIDARTVDLRLADEELARLREGAQAFDRIRLGLEAQLAEAQARCAALEADAEQPRDALGALGQEQARLLAEVEALRHRPPSVDEQPAPDADDVARRLRALQEEADAAARRAREAEDRMREAERRADAADAARAESVATARRWQLEAETARRDAAGVAAGMADREALRLERDEAVARAAEEAGRRAAARAQLQQQTDRADEAEAALAALRREREAPRNQMSGEG